MYSCSHCSCSPLAGCSISPSHIFTWLSMTRLSYLYALTPHHYMYTLIYREREEGRERGGWSVITIQKLVNAQTFSLHSGPGTWVSKVQSDGWTVTIIPLCAGMGPGKAATHSNSAETRESCALSGCLARLCLHWL